MVLIDFREWSFGNLGYLPNAQKELLQREFNALTKTATFKVVNLGGVQPFSLSSLFFENAETIAVSPLKNISQFYECIDIVLAAKNKEVIDYTEAAEEEVYFYGQNSLVSHLASEIALCGINKLTDESLFEEYCEDFELTPFSFELSNELLTSDVALFVEDTLLICLEFIRDKKTKKDLFSLLKSNQIKVITVTKDQVEKGVLNIKFVEKVLLMSKQTNGLLTTDQKEQLSNFKTEIVELLFLEKAGVKLRDIIA